MSKDLYDHKTKCKQCGYELPVPKSIRNPDVGSEFCSCQCRDVFQSEQEITRLRDIVTTLEWMPEVWNDTTGESKNWCPICDEEDVDGHTNDCKLAAALSPAEPVEKPPEQYRPSNGTEGMIFDEGWCSRCKKDEEYRRTEENGCPILAATMAYDIEDKEYPKEWIHDKDGNPCCTAFEPVEGEN